MSFHSLQNALRNAVADRIRSGELTGLALARKTGFRQAHISNFLNRRRGLSLLAMDEILKVLQLTVADLIDPAEINLRATIPPPAEGDYDNVLLVEPSAAVTQPVIPRPAVLDTLKFKKSFLLRLRPDMASPREQWVRFVLVKADAATATAMQPRMTTGATLLIDRHYNSIRPYRRGVPNIYAVAKNGQLFIRYIEVQDAQLLLRPHNQQHPLASLTIAPGRSAADYIVGRVCHVEFET